MSDIHMIPRAHTEVKIPNALRYLVTMPPITRRDSTGVVKHYIPCAHPRAPLGVYAAYVLSGSVLSLRLGPTGSSASSAFQELFPFPVGRYVAIDDIHERHAEWRIRVDRQTWPVLMAFMAEWSVWFAPAVLLWLELRAVLLNQPGRMGEEIEQAA